MPESKSRKSHAPFDLKAAREAVKAFSISCGVRCCLYDDGESLLFEHKPKGADCAFCRQLTALTGAGFPCGDLNRYAAVQSQRFGGRYTYFCPAGMAFFASPIVTGGVRSGCLIGGPVLIMDVEDFLSSDSMQAGNLDPAQEGSVRGLLLRVPQAEPKRLEYLSTQLFITAVYIGDSSQELYRARQEQVQQSAIGDYVARLKGGEDTAYPMEKEFALAEAISQGDRQEAGVLLNELLGHIFFYTPDAAQARSLTMELLVVLSRAAIHGGADADQILEITHELLQEMRGLNTQAELTRWLAASLNRFTGLVLSLLDVKHRNAIQGAIDYIRANYQTRITLGEVAQRAGYSPSYFSRIFREEIGVTFKEYLNRLRIEHSKALLLAGRSSNLDVCTAVGFTDQSYFCKVFRRVTGVTPDTFRKRARRIDIQREHGLK